MIKDRQGNILKGIEGQDNLLKKLYGTSAGRCALKILVCKFISDLGGFYMNSWLSKHQIKSFIQHNNIDMSQFEKVTLIAYSMGVCVASKICKDIQFHTTLAINGTNMGIDKLYGIHPILFNQTIKNFNLANFKKALFGNHISLAQNFFFDTTKSLIDELISLRNFCNETSEESGITWDKVLISKQDSIFPPQSCYNFFHLQKPQPIIIERNLVHYPFFSFQTWEEICMLHAS